MKPTKEHVLDQCKRLAAVPMIEPKTDEGKREVAEALLRNCQSNEHVTQVISAFLENTLDCQNIVAELVRLARITQKTDQPPLGCSQCEIGPDLETGAMQWRAHIVADGGAKRCSCRRGQWFAAKDREYFAVQPRIERKLSRPAIVTLGRATDRLLGTDSAKSA
jgi:hypothetical protein